ncbi:MAG: prolyl oligopeptidase family serine peptidase [Bacteroidota bacterium]
MKRNSLILLCAALLAACPFVSHAQDKLTFEDVMKFEDLGSPTLSARGNWLVFSVWPDRGDGYAIAQSVQGNKTYKLDLGKNPRISSNEKWVIARREVPLHVKLKEKKKAPKAGLSLLSLETGNIQQFDSVSAYTFSNNGEWLAMKRLQTKAVKDLKSKNKKLGTELVLRSLETGDEQFIPFVSAFEFDSLSNYLAYTVVDTSDSENGVYVVNLASNETMVVQNEEWGWYSNLTWEPKKSDLAFTASRYDTTYTEEDADLVLWTSKKQNRTTLVESGEVAEAYALRSRNRLRFTHDGKRLFFGVMDREMVDLETSKKDEESEKEIDIYNIDSMLEGRELDIWHGDDPLIKTQEIQTWNRRKNHLYMGVYHLGKKGKWVQLADKTVPDISIAHNESVVLGYSNLPYQKELTWDGTYRDWYVINLKTGDKTEFLTHSGSFVQLSPGGEFAAYYSDKHWYMYQVKGGATRSLTEGIATPFYNEDHDYPYAVPGYGMAGWIEKDAGILIYDKFDIWKFSTKGQESENITGGKGRDEQRVFRIQRLDPSKTNYQANEEVLLTSYHDLNKNFGFYSTKLNDGNVNRLLEENKKFTVVGKADDSDAILYKREAYDEFPNLWIADDHTFKSHKKHTNLHENLSEKWNWGKAELVDWLSTDGTYMQGIVIKPNDYDPNKRYPIMTYYYRFYTNRLHDFNEPKTNHRPVFAQYVSDGYVVFLPDVRFEIGRPGFAATKSVVPGVQKLVELGIADPDKLGLHGHSWSGYQTAFIVTQTDIFDAAVSGAPVSNMTSAYGGIRWASGRARSFQYEKTQSRIGETLVEAPLKYVENSPVFYADQITTPMLIQHGDDDGAVPWYQSIEMYLAMRRYDKDVIFLQYHGEPHHLQKFENKLDYAIRMKEYFDYYLKGEGEPEWIVRGEEYRGR